jgi:hypothetical protein
VTVLNLPPSLGQDPLSHLLYKEVNSPSPPTWGFPVADKSSVTACTSQSTHPAPRETYVSTQASLVNSALKSSL